MQKYLVRLPQEMRQLMLEAAEVASACNVRIFLVGGFVRDLILSRKNLDLDFLVEGDGIGFAQKLAERLGAVATSHRRFGTATVFLANHLKVDIASSREESYPQPAALPVVRPGTVEDDLRRRDFSINAMAISLNKQDYARMIDFFGGLDDLRRKKIRVLHSLSFTDDPLRILRAIRFEQRFGFKIEPQTLKLLKAAVKAKMLHKVHAHRIRDELILLLKEAEPVKQIERLQSLAGLSFIHPSLTRRKDSRSLFRAIARNTPIRQVSAGRMSRPAIPKLAQKGRAAGSPWGKPAAAMRFRAR